MKGLPQQELFRYHGKSICCPAGDQTNFEIVSRSMYSFMVTLPPCHGTGHLLHVGARWPLRSFMQRLNRFCRSAFVAAKHIRILAMTPQKLKKSSLESAGRGAHYVTVLPPRGRSNIDTPSAMSPSLTKESWFFTFPCRGQAISP